MARTIGISIFAFLLGILIGSIFVHKQNQKLWFKKFDDKRPDFFEKGRFDDTRLDRFPPELMGKLDSFFQLPDAKLAKKVEGLPFYQNLSLEERGKFMDRLNKARKKQVEYSNKKIDDLGLQLNEDQKAAFYQSLIDKRVANMRETRRRSQEIIQELEKKSDQELLQEFGGKK